MYVAPTSHHTISKFQMLCRSDCERQNNKAFKGKTFKLHFPDLGIGKHFFEKSIHHQVKPDILDHTKIKNFCL